MSKFKRIAEEVGNLVSAKNLAYGNSFSKCGDFLQLLYPEGLQPAQYGDALTLVRMFDKQMRIATCKDAFGESPYRDLMGYALLGAARDKTAADYAPLEPEEVQAINASISPSSLCGTCIRQNCPVDCAEHTTKCGEYLPPKGDRAGVEKAGSLCADCERWDCNSAIKGHDVAQCGDYIQPEPSSTSCRDCWTDCGVAGEKMDAAECQSHTPMAEGLNLPTITVEGDLEEVHEKYEEERQEWGQCNAGTLESDIEAWDVVQARQTYAERGGNVDVLTGGKPEYVLTAIGYRYAEAPEQVLAAKRAMIIKNAARAMYAPEVCMKIVMSGGKEY